MVHTILKQKKGKCPYCTDFKKNLAGHEPSTIWCNLEGKFYTSIEKGIWFEEPND